MNSVSVESLIRLLNSHIKLYNDIIALLADEKQAIIDWRVKDTLDCTQKKEELLHQERILTDARKALFNTLKTELHIEKSNLSIIIKAIDDEKIREDLTKLRTKLMELIDTVRKESGVIKMLYATNLNIINELYVQLGYVPTGAYGSNQSTMINKPFVTAIG